MKKSAKKVCISRKKRSRAGEIPQILHNKSRDLAFVLLGGKKVYLGKFGSPESEEKRLQKWHEFIATQKTSKSDQDSLTVAVLVDRFLIWAKSVYTKNGRQTGMKHCIY